MAIGGKKNENPLFVLGLRAGISLARTLNMMSTGFRDSSIAEGPFTYDNSVSPREIARELIAEDWLSSAAKHALVEFCMEVVDLRRARVRPKEGDLYRCDNCDFTESRAALPHAKDLTLRLEPGGMYTDKECPKCGALCFPVV